MTFLLLLALLLFNFADQSLLSPLLNPLLRDFFGDTARVAPLGWLSFLVMVLMAASMVVSGILADRSSRKRIAWAGSMIYGLASVLVVFTPPGRAGFAWFLALRCLDGLGLGTLVPAVFSMVADLVAPRRRATAFGAVTVAMLLGRLTGFAAAGSLAGRWRTAFLAVGLVNLALGLLLFLVREPARGARESELEGSLVAGAEYRFRLSGKDIRRLAANRSNVWLAVNFLGVIPGAIILFLIFKYAEDIHNLAPSAVNLILVAAFLAGGLGAMAFGRLGDWASQRDSRAKVAVALFCTAVPMAFMIVFLSARFRVPAGASPLRALAVPGVPVFVGAVAAAMFISQGVIPNWYGILAEVNLPEHRATMVAMGSLKDMVGNALGPLAASAAVGAWGLRTAMASSLVFWAASIFLWLPMLRTVPRDIAGRHRVLAERGRAIEEREGRRGRA
jgi:MFS family permease